MQPSIADSPPGQDALGYAPRPGIHDEVFDPAGVVRPHWQPFLDSVGGLGLPELIHRWEEAKHLIRENGVTYNVYGDPRGMARPWQLDPLPLLIAPAEAETVGAGLVQRGVLLERILADLYGPQSLLRHGLLPPELLFGNPGFLRPCHGIRLPGSRYLHLYAANVGRSPDGTLWVIGDRTQAPSGAGYALENRLVLSRTLPDVFRDCRVQRLALFFRTLRDTLRAIAPRNRDNPCIVLLTPGPYNETYFEHAYLARYLGYTLVEGGDLTVRDNRVFLKVLGGLQPVDVIFRRLDDDFCDSLELRADSFLGVPGLVHAVRTGNVAVANALGSGLVETPALLAFLPALCRELLGEELRLPSVPTWWCGEPLSLQHVLAHLPDMIIKPTFSSARLEPIFGDRLSREERRQLAERMKARPRDYVGQERVPLSTTPVLVGKRLQPRQLVIRTYLTARDDSFVVMPGGLTRVSANADTMVVSMQKGGGSKDTWVLSAGPVSTFSLLRPGSLPVELTRGGSDLPSRVADNLYWLGRYVERAEGTTRLLRGVIVRLTEKSGLGEVPELPALLRALTQQTQTLPGFIGEGAEERLAAPEAELVSLTFETKRIGSLAATVQSFVRVASMARDRISIDMWRVLSGLDRFHHAAADSTADNGEAVEERNGKTDRRTLSDVLDLLNDSVATLAAFGGLAMESMTRSEGWRFLDMGRKLERSMHMINLLRSTLVYAPASEGPLLEALLEIADSSMTYRRRYLGSLQSAAVLDLLLADETNPRSLAFQLVALADDVDHLPRDRHRPGRTSEQRITLASLTALRLADFHQLAHQNEAGTRPALDDLLSKLATDLPALSDSITLRYLSHLQASRHLAASSPEICPPEGEYP